MTQKNKLLLIDGNSIMNRGYFALPSTLTNSKGLHTNAILGFLNIFFKVYEEEKPDHIVVAFDVHEPTFRHKMYAEYKGTRSGMDPELREQFPWIKEILHSMKITTAEKGGFEADDLIGTYSRRAAEKGMTVSVLSGDRDLLQLATDTIQIRIPKTSKGVTTVHNYFASDVMEEYGVTPLQFIEMKGLMGDSSDNIPGVQGIGPKTASKIIQAFGSVEGAIEHIDEVKPDKARKNLSELREMAIFSRDLARIKLDCPLDVAVDDTDVSREQVFGLDAINMLKSLELRSVLKKFDAVNTSLSSSGNDRSEDGNGIVTGTLPFDSVDAGATSFEDSEQLAFPSEQINPSDIPTEEIEFESLLSLIKESQAPHFSLFPIWIDGNVAGASLGLDGKVYIIRGFDKNQYQELLTLGKTLVMSEVKKTIDALGVSEKDPVFDLSLGAYLIDPLAKSYSYEILAEKYANVFFEDEKKLLGKSEITIFSFDDNNFKEYLKANAYSLDQSYTNVFDQMKSYQMVKLYEEIEWPLLFVLRNMEKEGVATDKDFLTSYGKELEEESSKVRDRIYELAGQEFNINSSKQLGEILFEKLGLPAGKKTKTGYSTNADVLEKLKDSHEIIPLILKYRQIEKLNSTYIVGLLSCIGTDGRIHSTFNQTVTATGRLSSTEPNLQNIPTRTEMGSMIRKAFVPKKGCQFIDADYSQIELRVMADMASDEELISAFKESSDIHAITASKVFHVPLAEVDKSLRRKAKAVNFGIIYGISSFGLGEDLDISRKEADTYIKQYFETYQGIKKFLDDTVKNAKEKGYTETMFHRIRPIPELNNKNFMVRSFGERAAMNSPIQGTAADIIKIAMIRVSKALKEAGLEAKLILQIHDELLIEAPEDEVEQVKTILSKEMEEAVSLAVPLLVDMHNGYSLFEVK